MHYELWALNTGNLIADYDTESEVLSMVRELVVNGWDVDDLGVRLEWDDGEDGNDSQLPPADSQLPPALYGSTLAARLTGCQAGIESRAGVLGGRACIRGTRVPVWLLVQARRLGLSEARILDAFPTLRSEDLKNAWSYAHAHEDEIDRDIETNEAA